MHRRLQLDEQLYRAAEAAATRQGRSLSSFVEEAVRRLLALAPPELRTGPIELPTFAAGSGFSLSPSEIKTLDQNCEDPARQVLLGSL